MLQHGHGALVVGAAEQHLAEEREALTVGAVDLHDAEELALRFLPLVQRRVRTREHHPTFEAVGRGLEPEVADLYRIAGTPEGEICLTQVDERW